MITARDEADELLEQAREILDEATDALDTIVGGLSYDELATLRRRMMRLAAEADRAYERLAEAAEDGDDESLWDAADHAYALAVATEGHAETVHRLATDEIHARDWHTETE